MKSASGLSLLAAVGAGALATYFLDAQEGRRRRAVVRDKMYGKLSHLDDAGRVATADLRNRLKGTIGALGRRFAPQEEIADDVLMARVRSKLGRTVSHPGSIEVAASGGTVTLQGPILKREVKRAMQAVWAIPGVHNVIDRLEAHEQPGNVPGLQGGSPRSEQIDIAQQHWAPATRLLAGTAGTSLAACALARRNLASPLLLAGGIALLARAATNTDLKQLLGGRGRRSIDFSKTVHFDVPVERLFEFWSNFENFPRFMRHVRSVRRNSENNWQWEVAGPLGASIRWSSEVTQRIPNKVLAWATTPGASVQHAGLVRFEPEGSGTRMHVRMSYNPVAGVLGHAVASLFGADPLAEMDQDLMRLKTFFHTGRPARDAAQAGAQAPGGRIS
jgi:uncharacterized membrane protein